MKTPIPPVLLPRSPPCPVSAQEEFQVNSLDPTVRNLQQLQAGSRQAVNALLGKELGNGDHFSACGHIPSLQPGRVSGGTGLFGRTGLSLPWRRGCLGKRSRIPAVPTSPR